MRYSSLLIVSLVIFLFGCSSSNKKEADSEKNPVVAISQFVTHPALDEVRKGIIEGLASKGYVDGENITIDFKNANADETLTQTIAEEFARQSVDVIVPISTASTLGAAKATERIPIIFSGVTDPVTTGLVKDPTKPDKNITGLSDRWPFKKQLNTFLDFFPEKRVIGVLYKPGDDVSKIGIDALTALQDSLDFELVTQPVSSATDVYVSALGLFRQVDVIYTGIDHLILENMGSLMKASEESNKLVFGGESGSVENGAIMAQTINMYDFGVQTSAMVIKVLEGIEIKDIPVEFVSDGDLYINKNVAEKFGLDLEKAKRYGAKFFK